MKDINVNIIPLVLLPEYIIQNSKLKAERQCHIITRNIQSYPRVGGNKIEWSDWEYCADGVENNTIEWLSSWKYKRTSCHLKRTAKVEK